MKQVVGVPEPLFLKIVQYLQERPWKEANPLLAAVEREAIRVDVNEPDPEQPAQPSQPDQAAQKD